MSLGKLQRDWEDLGDLDPCWAVLADPGHRFGGWNIDEFFLTGEQEIEGVMESAGELGHPLQRELALDFGCGVGRLTRALAKHFECCYGIDIAESMIARARELNASVSNCRFVVNTTEHLQVFPDSHFDLIYTSRVLQHMPDTDTIRAYLVEFVRVLKEGGLLVFQLPSQIPLRRRLQLRRRLYALLKACGFSSRFLYEKLRLWSPGMTHIPEVQVRALLAGAGAKVLRVEADSVAGPLTESRTYFVTK